MAHSNEIKQTCLLHYLNTGNLAEAARKLDLPYRTAQSWYEKGELTNGKCWKDIYEQQTGAVVTNAAALIEETLGPVYTLDLSKIDSLDDFREEAFEGLKVLYASVFNRLLQTGKIQPSDLKVIVDLMEKLDDQGGKILDEMDKFVSEVFGIAMKIMDERQQKLFREEIVKLQERKRKELEPLRTPFRRKDDGSIVVN